MIFLSSVEQAPYLLPIYIVGLAICLGMLCIMLPIFIKKTKEEGLNKVDELKPKDSSKVKYLRSGGVNNFRLLGYATGTYECICSVCSGHFQGDKRSSICLDCTLRYIEKKL